MLFLGENQPTSIAIGWSEPVSGRELHPPKSSAFTGHFISNFGRRWRATTVNAITITNRQYF